MALFSYNAVTRDGGRVSGQVEAQSRAEAFRKLDNERLQPISLVQQDGVETNGARPPAGGEPVATRNIRLSGSQIILFTEEMSDLLDAGLQLEPALRVMEGRNELSSIKAVASALRQQVREGSSLSNALRLVSPSFGDLFCNLVAAGELSGSLPKLLRRQATFLVAMDDLRKKVVSALIYPAMIFVLGIGLIFLFMTYLVPQLMTLFQKTGRELPLLTRILVQTSGFFSHYWWAIIGGIAAAVVGFLQLIRMPSGRQWWHRTQLRLPLFGSVLRGRFYGPILGDHGESDREWHSSFEQSPTNDQRDRKSTPSGPDGKGRGYGPRGRIAFPRAPANRRVPPAVHRHDFGWRTNR